ncbi:hypothetical protein [Stenotrophomonas sp. CC120222-04]|uniref:hypothetical protein n=1 Tax=Stenotrophomonas sp. CC120222-04 TaxID=1378088 RepID=UPI000B670424|nr:hypothetical protein [Stenotrophomonas sp. CC120222-04]SNT83731.1 hypothetical protein SAMN02744786_3579 [Stenotrophomonas sp. CC120222-04]
MTIVESEFLKAHTFLKQHLDSLREEFHPFAATMESALSTCREQVVGWNYSLGDTLDLVPHERLIPSIPEAKGRVLAKLTRQGLNSRRLIKYGFDDTGAPILEIRRLDKDIERFGELVRFVSRDLIVCSQIFNSGLHPNRLKSLTRVIRQGNSIHYVSVNPPHHWAVRSDLLCGSRISTSSFMATSWHRPLDYDFVYDSADRLDAILIGDHTHWSAS